MQLVLWPGKGWKAPDMAPPLCLIGGIRQLQVAALEVTEQAQAELEGRAGVRPLNTPGPGPVIPRTNYLESK